jgi:hypothetical protein
MPRDGALVLSDLRQPTLSIVCAPCGRRGRYSVAKLMEQYGDAKLMDLLVTLAALPEGALGQHPRPVQGGPRAAAAISLLWRGRTGAWVLVRIDAVAATSKFATMRL